jgi:hypothetical protein
MVHQKVRRIPKFLFFSSLEPACSKREIHCFGPPAAAIAVKGGRPNWLTVIFQAASVKLQWVRSLHHGQFLATNLSDRQFVVKSYGPTVGRYFFV